MRLASHFRHDMSGFAPMATPMETLRPRFWLPGYFCLSWKMTHSMSRPNNHDSQHNCYITIGGRRSRTPLCVMCSHVILRRCPCRFIFVCSARKLAQSYYAQTCGNMAPCLQYVIRFRHNSNPIVMLPPRHTCAFAAASRIRNHRGRDVTQGSFKPRGCRKPCYPICSRKQEHAHVYVLTGNKQEEWNERLFCLTGQVGTLWKCCPAFKSSRSTSDALEKG